MRSTFLLYAIFTVKICMAQTFSGLIFDSKTKEPIQYVNIGIVKKAIGTVSDEKGAFNITLEDQYNADTLRISMIGYETQNFVVADFKKQFPPQDATILLKPTVSELKEVVVKPGKIKYTQLGNDYHSKNVTAG